MRNLIYLLRLLVTPGRFNQPPRPESHPLSRLQGKRYHDKKQVVKGLWIAAGILMLIYPLLPFIVTLSLFTTFLAFTILDESA